MRPIPLEPTNRRPAIGPRLRAARRARGLTIDEVAQVTGLTKGFLSRVERDITSPSVSSLIQVCDVLSVAVGDLFEEPDVQLVRAGEGPRVNFGGSGVVEHLVTPRGESRVQVIRSDIHADGHGGDDFYVIAAEVDFVHVIAGSIEVRFSGQRWELAQGDSLTFSGAEPHTWKVLGDDGATLLWVLVPAVWSPG